MKHSASSNLAPKKPRVLVVDDDADSRDFLVLALESYGIEAHTVSSVQQALRVFTSLQPDVLISDIVMPDEDGYSLIRKIRRLGTRRHALTPAIALTAASEKAYEALSHGFHCLLQKPVDVEALVSEIGNLVRSA